MKGFKDSNNKFHPITTYKSVRKKKDKTIQPDGVRLSKHTPAKKHLDKTKKLQKDVDELHREAIPLSEAELKDWEKTVKSKVTGFTTTTIDGKTVLELTFENKQKWFEFKSEKDENDFIEEQVKVSVNKPRSSLNIDPRLRDNLEVDPKNPKVEKFVRDTLGKGDENFKEELSRFKDLPSKFLTNHARTANDAIQAGAVEVNFKDFINQIEGDNKRIPANTLTNMIMLDHKNVEGYVFTDAEEKIFERRIRADDE